MARLGRFALVGLALGLIACGFGRPAAAGTGGGGALLLITGPTSGPPTTEVGLTGSGFSANEPVDIYFDTPMSSWWSRIRSVRSVPRRS